MRADLRVWMFCHHKKLGYHEIERKRPIYLNIQLARIVFARLFKDVEGGLERKLRVRNCIAYE